MRGLADRWRPRGLRPPAPAGRHTLPVALAALAIVAAASTSASGARVTEAGTLPPASVGMPAYPGGGPTAPEFQLPTGSATAPAASPGTARPAGSPGSPGCALGVCDQGPATGEAAQGMAANGIPTVALTAYRAAEKRMATERPACGISWTLIAAIGRVESNHGRFAGATLLRDGRSDPPILGVALDGSRAGVARITDTDGGRFDGDASFDRAVGPMQFIPSTWALFAVDGDGDGRSDPFDIDDVALAAAGYLCKAGGDLATLGGQRDAVFAYNHSEEYVRLVLDLAGEYATGARVDDLPSPDRNPRPLPAPRKPVLPPATVGTPPATTPRPTTPAPTTTRPKPSTSPPATRSPTPTPTPSPTCTPAPTPTGTPTGSPTTSPSPTPTPSPTTPTPTPSGSGSPTVTPTPSPTLPTCPT